MPDSLWEFASTTYQRPGVAAACLALQDAVDADINMLLAAAWLGTRGRHWRSGQVEGLIAACAQWRALCLLPLRRIRRDLKGIAGAENWYERIKALELEAERQQLHRIEEAIRASAEAADSTPAATAMATVEANVSDYLATLGVAPAAAKPLLEALLAAEPASP